jgi:hypothetical protein
VTSFAELKAAAKRRVRYVDVCIDQSLAVEHDRLTAALQAADAEPSVTMADGGTARALAEQITALERQMAGERVRFHFQALAQRAFLAIMDDHQPRDDEEGKPLSRDAAFGYNYETFPPAIIAAASIEPPEGQSGVDKLDDAQAAELFHDMLSAADAEAMLDAAMRDNVIPSQVPFSVLASATLLGSEQK